MKSVTRGLLLLAVLVAGATSARAQETVRGRVTSEETQAPLSGVTVRVRGGSQGTITDAQGRYVIVVPSRTATLVFSLIGYAAQEVAVAGQEVVDVALRAAAVQLEELVAVGYTTQTRRNVSGAVASVQAEELRDRKVATLEEALRGRMAGVNIVASGEPGRASQVIVRGQNFLGSVAPLYVIDGMYTRQNPNLNPEDIESIEVLKDASAAAQYGAQSANGVIVIRTKRGRGEPRVTFSSYAGYQDVPRRIDLVDADRWLEIARQARQNAGVPFDPTFRFTANTDWQDEVFQRGAIQDHNVTVSGGSESASYLIGAGYFDQTGTIIDTGFERYSFRVNSEARLGRLRVGQTAALARAERDNVVGFPLIDVVRFQPGIPVRDPNNPGGYGFGFGSDRDFTSTFGTNPVGAFEREDNRDIMNRVLGSLYGELDLVKSLRYRLNLGLDYQDVNWTQFVRQRQIRHNTPQTFNEGRDRRDNFTSLLAEHLLMYDGSFGPHEVSAVAGVTEQSNRFERLEAYRRGFANEDLTQINAGTSTFENQGFEIPHALRGLLSRVNYSFADKYLLTATFRRDGSSRFGSGNRYGNFASGSVGYVVSEEDFYASIPLLGRAVGYLKLRASYGSLGNEEIGDFAYSATVVTNQSYPFGNTIAPGATQVSLANPNIRWQDQTQTNVGADLSLLGDRLSLSTDYYVSESDGLLVTAPIPWSLGAVGSPTVNAGRIRNSGFELSAQYRQETDDLSLTWAANLTTIKNRVLELGNGGQPIFAGFASVSRTTVGGSIGEFFVLKTAGIFQSEAEVQAHRNSKGEVIQPNAQPGDIRFADLNDDGLINDEDRYVAGSPIPDLEGGFNLDASYRSFSFGLSLRGSYGAEIFNVARFWTDRLDENSAFRADLSPWTPSNRDTRDPRAVFGPQGASNARANTDRWIEDGSYLRVQNLVLGYQIPESAMRRLGIGAQRSRVYLNIQNLHTFTSFSNWDPEVRGFDSPLTRGIDDGRIYPNPRTFTIGVDLNL